MRGLLHEVDPRLFITASHDLSREYREYERTSTTAANAYVGPRVSAYLERLESQLDKRAFGGKLLIMQSSGGLCDVATAGTQCIQMLESGPAGGVVGAAALSTSFGTDDLICFDMGGTTAKACVLRSGKASLSSDYFVGGYNEGLVVRVPVIDIKEVGTGGGSIAWIDEGGGLHVGPESAGASPGPASYGRGGTLPTVTDANLLLGRLSAQRFLGGRMPLDAEAATRAIKTHIAEPLGLEVHEAALGIVEIANAAMANAVRAVTTERGLDPRDFTLVAYGGAGPMHAAEVARDLSVNRVLIPNSPGHFSAVGMLMADLRREYVRTHFVPLTVATAPELDEIYGELESEARSWLAGTELPSDRITVEYSADMRYVGQEHSVNIAIASPFTSNGAIPTVKALFDAVHQQMYSHSAPEENAEIVSLRVSIIGHLPKPDAQRIAFGSGNIDGTAIIERRTVRFAKGDARETTVYDRAHLLAGDFISGPAIIQELASSTTVPIGATVTVTDFGHLLITVGEQS
jgi:N-methylhydantoinase A